MAMAWVVVCEQMTVNWATKSLCPWWNIGWCEVSKSRKTQDSLNCCLQWPNVQRNTIHSLSEIHSTLLSHRAFPSSYWTAACAWPTLTMCHDFDCQLDRYGCECVNTVSIVETVHCSFKPDVKHSLSVENLHACLWNSTRQGQWEITD